VSTQIFYYTGTGNSLWVARKVAEAIEDAELCSIAALKDRDPAITAETAGLVFPVHIWGVPAPVLQFAASLTDRQSSYIFAIAVNAGQVSNTLVQLQKTMAEHHLTLSAGFEIPMPSNYIPWGGPGPKEKQNRRFEKAREKITHITDTIRNKVPLPVEKGPLWQRILFTAIYRASFSRVPSMDQKFWVDEKCNACEICYKVCPAGNITMHDGKPVWHHRCEQCFACLQWCPQEAIQYGKKTPHYERYHHPEIHLKDILKKSDT
jgi:Fe-S-cluster-containing hydrogenase component 2